MAKNIERGIFRLLVVLAALWIAGMGFYQYQEANKAEKNSITFSLSKDAQIRIDANGISDNKDKNSMQLQRLEAVFLPPLLLLAIFPIGAWMARGFKSDK
jgi:hypothetical protein